MKKIKFNHSGGRLRVNFRFEGDVAASYIFNYFEANSNDLVIKPSPQGNNLNNDDDNFRLPMPSQLNRGRVIMLHTWINALDNDSSYKIIIQVFQENELIDTHEHKGSIVKGGQTQNPMVIVQLD
jgi:hypothetical protein